MYSCNWPIFAVMLARGVVPGGVASLGCGFNNGTSTYKILISHFSLSFPLSLSVSLSLPLTFIETALSQFSIKDNTYIVYTHTLN